MTGRLQGRYRRLLEAARAVLWWERLRVRTWPAVSVAALFLAAALSGLLPLLPGWLHLALLTGFAGTFAWLLVRGLRGLRRVTRAEARARLERDSGLDHHPLTALEDRPLAGAGDPAAETLWNTHLLRAAAAARNLRLAVPATDLAGRDPWALRFPALLVLVVAAVSGFGEWGERMERALIPAVFPPPADVTLDAWITPPAYTGRAPVHLSHTDGTEGPLPVPEGSTLLVQTGGAEDPPWIAMGERPRKALETVGAGAHRLETRLLPGPELSVGIGRHELARWALDILSDKAPRVRFIRPPEGTPAGRLDLSYAAADDYGVTALNLEIERPGADGERTHVSLPLASHAGTVAGRTMPDLSAHAWAGLPVRVTLSATDAAGREGRSETVGLILPERWFTHPVARRLADIRRLLAEKGDAARGEAMADLLALTAAPDAYGGDMVVHLALTVARRRLALEPGPDALDTVRSILWKTALRLEDGGLSLAENELDRLGQALERALDGGDDADLRRLGEELSRALDLYLSAMVEHLLREGFNGMPVSPGEASAADDALKRLVDEIRDLTESGAHEAARARLAELRSLLERMAAGLRAGAENKDLAEAMRLMEQLRDIEARQKTLLDETYEGLRAERTVGGAPDQERLRRETGRLADRTEAEKPGALREAADAMARAAEALASGRAQDAVDAQTESLDALGRARDAAAEKAMQLGRGMPGLLGLPGGDRKAGTDPFGRMRSGVSGGMGGIAGDGPRRLVGPEERRRSRAILDTLRERAGDGSRPAGERDYIRRLLRRF